MTIDGGDLNAGCGNSIGNSWIELKDGFGQFKTGVLDVVDPSFDHVANAGDASAVGCDGLADAMGGFHGSTQLWHGKRGKLRVVHTCRKGR